MKVELVESAALAIDREVEGRKWLVKLISANTQGSSGYYTEETLRRDGPKAFKPGTPIFVDHQMTSERRERPFGSVSNYAGQIAEDVFYDSEGPEGAGLYGYIEIFEDMVPFVRSRAKNIGMSIRAMAEKVQGKITEIKEAISLDLVMRAGAGGKLITAVESAVQEQEQEETLELEQLVEAVESLTKVVEAQTEKIEALEAKSEVVEEAPVEESAGVDVAKVLATSGLSESGIDRVYDLHKATGKDIAELVESEKAYLIAESKAKSDNSGVLEVEESATEEVEESAKKEWSIPVLSAWKDNK